MSRFTHFSPRVQSGFWRGHSLISLCLLLIALLNASSLAAQTFPANFTQVVVASGLTSPPTVIAFAPDGRAFVAQQGGNLRVIKNGNLLPDPFIRLTVDSTGERGLLGIAFDPAFSSNQYIYLYYTVPATGTVGVHNRVSRFTAMGNVVLAGSETIILELDPLSATNHNGGSIVFGQDQKLYIGTGENANPGNSQSLDNYLGKVLRINSDGTVPAGNPFTTGSEAKKRIWSYGLRNPYTLTVQPGTGRLFVNDVGQGAWEEINDATVGGLNFGWPIVEGASTNPDHAAYTNPVYAYAHGGGDGVGCAITGGTFYNPATTRYPPAFIGTYFYQDFCSNWINVLDVSGPTAVRSPFATDLAGLIVGLTVGTDGYLYYLSLSAGAVYKITYTGENCQSLQTGNWHDPSNWSCGRVPISADKATVRHVVTIGTGLVSQVRQIQYEAGGQLVFTGNSKLQVGL
ncbi:PQQ-dependent sugar dehydrogenase [Spirosoma areae]